MNLINSLQVGRERVEISHVQFTDDTLFFVKNVNHLLFLVEISFCQMSGLKINMEKNSLLGLNSEEEEVEGLSSEIGCGKETWPIIYIGVPPGRNPLKISFWELE